MKSEVYNEDCMIGMRRYPDKYFDLAVVDPVYGGVTQGGYMKNQVSGGLGPHPKYNIKLWEQEKTGKPYFEELFRVSKNQIIWGGNYFCEEIAQDSQCWIVWDKCHPDGVKYADAELAWTSFNTATRIFRFLWNGMLQGTPGNGTKMQADKSLNEKKIHPTQKPVALYTWIFQNYAKPGQKILDTHMGSQSSRIAAYEADLEFTGFEIDKTYFDLGNERFETHISQISFFHMDEIEERRSQWREQTSR